MLNFDPIHGRPPLLSTPKSKEACKRQGIAEEELLFIPFEEYKKRNRSKVDFVLIVVGENLEGELLKIKYQHYEDRRKDKIRVLIQVNYPQEESISSS